LDEMKVGSFCYQSGYLSLGLMDWDIVDLTVAVLSLVWLLP
jgi:hypothetical protein